jgi:iron complex outermembrane receptor protein
MKPNTPKTLLALALATTGGLSAAPQAIAADVALEEIVVTARKREESLQDVGLAVSAMSQTEIARSFARDLTDLASVSPNLIIDDTAQGPGGVAAIFIRGVGVADVEKNFDPAVGVVMDGIFLGANAGSLLRSIDLASVEVLRGPQGTLFGRNTIGGLINVTRTQPTMALGAKIRAGIEDYDTFYADGIINFGITENLGAKITLGMRDQGDGYYDNDFEGDDLGANDYQTYGINLLWDVNDDLEFEMTYQVEETDQDTPPLLNTGQQRHLFCNTYGYCSPSEDKPITGDRLETANYGLRPNGDLADLSNPFKVYDINDVVRAPMDASFDTDAWSFETRWNISEAWRLDYLYGHWESDEEIVSNWDGTPELLYGTNRPATYEQDSHELRFTYDNGGNLSFVTGIYYWDSEYDIDLNSWVSFNPAFPASVLDVYQYTKQTTESRAIFFEGDYAITEAWTLTLGGRYTEDEKESRQMGAQANAGR